MRKIKNTLITTFTILLVLSLVLFFALPQVFAEKIIPKAINSFSGYGKNVTSKYGLTIFPTKYLKKDPANELHILDSSIQDVSELKSFANANIIRYSSSEKQYPLDVCLIRIEFIYGTKFMNCVKLMLDYN